MPTNIAIADELRWKKFPVLGRRIRLPRRRDGRRSGGRASRARQLRRRHAQGIRRPRADPLLDAASPHHPVRNGGDQISGARADGLLAAMDPSPHRQRERVQHPLFAGNRRHSNHARPISGALKPPPTARGAARPCARNRPRANRRGNRISSWCAKVVRTAHRRRCGPRTGPQGFAPFHVHRSVLEDRFAQSAPFLGAADGCPRSRRNSRLRHDDWTSRLSARCFR